MAQADPSLFARARRREWNFLKLVKNQKSAPIAYFSCANLMNKLGALNDNDRICPRIGGWAKRSTLDRS